MNIWFLNDNQNDPDWNTTTFNLMETLVSKGHFLTVYSPSPKPEKAKGVRWVPVNVVSKKRNGFNIFCDLFFGVTAYLLGSKSDAGFPHIIVDSSAGCCTLSAYFLARKYRAKFFIQMREETPTNHLKRFCADRADFVINHSWSNLATHIWADRFEKVMYQSLGVDPKRFQDIDSMPFVSIVLPCRNEIACIRKCIESIVVNTYPQNRLEILIVDGMSTDGTRQVLADLAQANPSIRLLDNPKLEQQLAMNIGLANARGEIIMRMGAHDKYAPNYIEECVNALQHHPADNVGGGWVAIPRHNTLIGRSICFAMSVPFGVGNAYYRLTDLNDHQPFLKQPRWEIHIAYPCCRREVFEAIGPFNEHLTRSEDIEFRSRIKKAGYRSLYVPTIRCHYMMRTRFWEFVRHMFLNGQWVILPFNHAPNIVFSLRHVVPLVFLLLVCFCGALSFYISPFHHLIQGILVAYLAVNLYYSFRIAGRERDLRYGMVIPFIFISLHFAYGLGSSIAIMKLMRHRVFGEKDSAMIRREIEKVPA